MFTLLKTVIGSFGSKITLVWVLIPILTIIGSLYWQNIAYKKEIVQKVNDNAALAISANSYKNQLEDQIKETKRINAIAKELQTHIDNARPIIEERIQYVKTYTNNNDIVKCELSNDWVQLHNLYTTSPFITSPKTNTE